MLRPQGTFNRTQAQDPSVIDSHEFHSSVMYPFNEAVPVIQGAISGVDGVVVRAVTAH